MRDWNKYFLSGQADDGAASSLGGHRSFRLITFGGVALLNQDGNAVTALGPRNLALLTYLALATKPLTRDHVAELFWGDRGEERARHSMREALSKLRQVLGPDSIARRSDRVLLDPSVALSVDARVLASASTAGDTRTVVALYAGPFLEGVHTSGARSFEDWSDAERSMYEARFTAACAVECARLRQTALGDCAELARRWLQAAPLDPKAAIALLEALASSGTADSLRLATREYHAIAERLAVEFELAPHATVIAVADRIAHRAEAMAAEALRAPKALPPAEAPETATTPEVHIVDAEPSDFAVTGTHEEVVPVTSRAMGPERSKRLAAVAVLVAGVAALVLLYAGSRAAPNATADGASIAIVPFEVVSSAGGRWLANGAPRLLGASLSREHIVSVVDPSRLRDALASPDTDAAPSSHNAFAAARSLGARWMLTGSVIAGGGRYWLDVWLSDVQASDHPRRITVSDSTLDAVISQVTATLIATIDSPKGGAQLVEFDPKTVTGYHAYMRAMQLRAQKRDGEAVAVLDGAIAADSSFVAAVMERRYLLGVPSTRQRMDTAMALDAAYAKYRSQATEFERLYFDTYLALHNGDHARAEASGRALVERYPSDPRAYNRALEVLLLHGRFAQATLLAQRAVALDSAGSTSNTDECRVCIGYRMLSEIARIDGNLPRADAMARRATELSPQDPAAWEQLATVLSGEGSYPEAITAGRRAGGLAPTDPDFAMTPIRLLLESREYDAADSALAVWSTVSDSRFALNATDLRILLLRERGQFGAAARLVKLALDRFPADSNWLLLVQGEGLSRLGDVRGVRRAFGAAVAGWPLANGPNNSSNYSGDRARTNTWPRALLADALWENGATDTIALSVAADSIQAIGSQSYFGRDWRVYHHVRGLIAMSEHRWVDAEREFGQSQWEHSGWQRSLVERAHAEVAAGRPAVAVITLRDGYTSPLAGMGRYVPRSELDFEMARAFAAAGAMDSARVYARYAASAWRSADPAVRRKLTLLPVTITRQSSATTM